MLNTLQRHLIKRKPFKKSTWENILFSHLFQIHISWCISIETKLIYFKKTPPPPEPFNAYWLLRLYTTPLFSFFHSIQNPPHLSLCLKKIIYEYICCLVAKRYKYKRTKENNSCNLSIKIFFFLISIESSCFALFLYSGSRSLFTYLGLFISISHLFK